MMADSENQVSNREGKFKKLLRTTDRRNTGIQNKG